MRKRHVLALYRSPWISPRWSIPATSVATGIEGHISYLISCFPWVWEMVESKICIEYIADVFIEDRRSVIKRDCP